MFSYLFVTCNILYILKFSTNKLHSCFCIQQLPDLVIFAFQVQYHLRSARYQHMLRNFFCFKHIFIVHQVALHANVRLTYIRLLYLTPNVIFFYSSQSEKYFFLKKWLPPHKNQLVDALIMINLMSNIVFLSIVLCNWLY